MRPSTPPRGARDEGIASRRTRGSIHRRRERHAEVGERKPGFLVPGIEYLADADAVLLALGLAQKRTPVLERLHHGIGEDERVLAGHPQEIGTGVAAELVEALGEIVPERDDALAGPLREIGAEPPCSSASSIIAAELACTDLSLPRWRMSRRSPISASTCSSLMARTFRGSKPRKTFSKAGHFASTMSCRRPARKILSDISER